MDYLSNIVIGIMFLSMAAFADWPKNASPIARAILQPKSGSSVTGTFEFAKTHDGLLIKASIAHLSPGNHGFHIHDKGDCSAPDAASAGDHYNPTGGKHSAPNSDNKHAGDFGNVMADERGVGEINIKISTPRSKQFPGWDKIIGKSIVIHEKADDLKTQPSGDSGKRIACGTIDAIAESAK